MSRHTHQREVVEADLSRHTHQRERAIPTRESSARARAGDKASERGGELERGQRRVFKGQVFQVSSLSLSIFIILLKFFIIT